MADYDSLLPPGEDANQQQEMSESNFQLPGSTYSFIPAHSPTPASGRLAHIDLFKAMEQ